jgi:hypothetical protein
MIKLGLDNQRIKKIEEKWGVFLGIEEVFFWIMEQAPNRKKQISNKS